ncbi:hypothetical protein Pro02_26440 [Planobispora rosea]|uniref:DUF397 domain-containing protein n=1 Tax=Planobispora rosea TaxID=35762 RepID=A0A8J3RW76_PLARO|nr:hypothetical protein Pro02_26440 [Planobispora rosea]
MDTDGWIRYNGRVFIIAEPLPDRGLIVCGAHVTSFDPGDTFWVKSSLSSVSNECVEVARPSGGPVLVRDSKDLSGPVLAFTQSEWRAFLARVRSDGFGS